MINFINNCTETPYIKFKEKYEQATRANQNLIEAVSISSYSKNLNEVDSRFVNLKLIDGKNFIFFSNYYSSKAIQFDTHDQISALIYWSSINIQIRIKANISKLSTEFNEEYFLTRSKEKNALAISSNQSQEIRSYESVKNNYQLALSTCDLKKCPEYWGGYSFTPYSFEFWHGHESRINKRRLYKRDGNNWIKSTLEP